tara:strand:- start:58 stop:933 length:876 start_codon:yes stop_codon:yes gene_type:complete
MIGFNLIGKLGKLGNDMFQSSALIGIAKHRGFDYCIPDHSEFTDYGGYEHHELQGCFELPHFEGKYGIVNGGRMDIFQYDFCEKFMNECPDNISIFGYFQTEKYFKHCENIIRENFTFKSFIQEKCLKYGENFLSENPVALHVRRGDFLAPKNYYKHFVCHLDYYENAVKLFPNRKFLIFSDDIDWCKNQKLFLDNECFFVDNNIEIYKAHFDLCLMTMCNDFIIANSTFSWWGAWLSSNQNKKVIAPETWFGKEYYESEKSNTKDLLPENWIRVKNIISNYKKSKVLNYS